jgi:hypothetical protein
MRRQDESATTEDIESDGIPSYADEDSDAYDDLGQRKLDDSPPALPGGAPDMLDRHGTTAEEQRVGEPLDSRLAQEEPDIPVENPLAQPGRALSDEATSEAAAAQAPQDADVLDADGRLESDPDSAVSLYDRPEVQVRDDGVGRLRQPDAGFGEDTEKDEIALDTGERLGALPEETAMHEVSEDDLSG